MRVDRTAAQIAGVVKVELSLTRSMFMHAYFADMYRSIEFNNGEVSASRTGHDGRCLGPLR